MKGIFWNKKGTLITNFFHDTNLKVNQIQDTVDFTYSLETQFLNAMFSDYLTLKVTLANEIFITDYNCCNTEEYCDFPVRVKEFEDTKEFSLKRGRIHILIFGDRTENHRKRNFR